MEPVAFSLRAQGRFVGEDDTEVIVHMVGLRGVRPETRKARQKTVTDSFLRKER